MKNTFILITAIHSFLLLPGCQDPANSVLQHEGTSQIYNPLPDWQTKSITVCTVASEAVNPEYIQAVKETVVREFGRVGFDFNMGWQPCNDIMADPDERAAFTNPRIYVKSRKSNSLCSKQISISRMPSNTLQVVPQSRGHRDRLSLMPPAIKLSPSITPRMSTAKRVH